MVKYDTEFMKTEAGAALYNKWNRMRRLGCCPERKADFMAFVKWSMVAGFEEGATLKRYHKEKPYQPSNCYWVVDSKLTNPTYKASAFCASWNKTVNRIRKHYGMEQFEVAEPDFTEKTCKDCVHYKVCKYKKDGSPVCEDFLD